MSGMPVVDSSLEKRHLISSPKGSAVGSSSTIETPTGEAPSHEYLGCWIRVKGSTLRPVILSYFATAFDFIFVAPCTCSAVTALDLDRP